MYYNIKKFIRRFSKWISRFFQKQYISVDLTNKDVLRLADSLNVKIQELEDELKYTKKLAEADETISAKDNEINELKREMREQYYNS